MINPGPRPALRKAPDADLHPASSAENPQEVSVEGAIVGATEPAAVIPLQGRSRRLGGATSDTLLPRKQSPNGKPARKPAEKRVQLRVRVPKSVRAQLRARAKARGTSVDDVVSTVLAGWLDA